MAPSAGHLLLPKIWRAARFAYEKASRALRAKLPEPTQSSLRHQPAYARVSRHPIPRAAAIRQARSRHFSTRAAFVSAIRSGLQADTAVYKSTRIATNVSRLTSQAPFASTLRPNLTGGALGRTAGGYAVGAGRFGGARYFSHGPAAPAQVIQNVSQGVRAFFLSGQKVRFDGIDPRTGDKRYKAVSSLQDQAERQMLDVPYYTAGSHLDFKIAPVIASLDSKKIIPGTSKTLNTEGFMDLLSGDFARSLQNFAATINDLKKLSKLGDLPITLLKNSTIRIRFPGCDADTVARLCDEVGVHRGIIVEDADFELCTGSELALLFPFAPSVAPPCGPEPALRFPFAPSAARPSDPKRPKSQSPNALDWKSMMSPEPHTPSSGNVRELEISFEDNELFGRNPWNSSASTFSRISMSELGDRAYFPDFSVISTSESGDSEGVQGIHRFLEECNQAARGEATFL
ncbi:hypothetical protein N7510_007611 [Penicillium lagena]|uniref:uncharacterized protein n=1 Tax=Penicillium lagena TaxID=94218 RepID=UPI00253FCC3F|nr:uncharacterized protein N7510_007611 [Penicillium lagena]KAJ5610892.1 hypothetical protein N7510_007611 [Penicillium lagena]